MTENRKRCPWGQDEAMTSYHDTEWGRPTREDRALFELLVLEGAQAGLSWKTILQRRAGYKAAFHGFAPESVASFGERDRRRLLEDTGIIRNRAKIDSAIGNAQAFLEVAREQGSFSAYLWDWVGGKPIVSHWSTPDEVPAWTALSEQLSRDLLRRGFRFFGPTIAYAYMQATGLVMDHLVRCFVYDEVTSGRATDL